MIKKITIIIASLCAIEAVASEQIEVSEQCSKTIEQINRDSNKLYSFFKNRFETISTAREIKHAKPSSLLDSLLTSETAEKMNKTTKLEYASASWYVDYINNKKGSELDEAFATQLIENGKDIRQTWSWFSAHFKQEALVLLLDEYRAEIIRKDQKGGAPFAC